MAVVEVVSPKLGPLLVCDSGTEFVRVISSGDSRPVFLRAELTRLRRAALATWQAVVDVKTIFPGAVVLTHTKRRKRRAPRRPGPALWRWPVVVPREDDADG